MSISVSESTTVKKKVQVWIYSQDRKAGNTQILLLKTIEERGGFWQPVTGSVEEGEDLLDAALREATEETGLSFEGKVFFLDHSFEYEKKGVRFHEYGYALQKNFLEEGPPRIRLDAHEHQAYQWVSASVARTQVHFDSNRHILDVLLMRLRTK